MKSIVDARREELLWHRPELQLRAKTQFYDSTTLEISTAAIVAKYTLGGSTITNTPVCEIVLGKLPQHKEKPPEGAPKFSIQVYEVIQQRVDIFADSRRLKLAVLSATGTKRIPRCR
jgi:hypothetical protein